MPGVPVIDISADPVAVGAELDEICRTTGFFQITGHGIEDGVAGPHLMGKFRRSVDL